MYRKPFCSRLDFDLVQAAKNVLDFLRQVDEYPADLYKGPFLKNAIRRYEVFWLPLAAKEGYGSRFLAAPLDIAWVWHVHMLAPYNYEQDCINCVSKIVDHAPLGGVHLENGLERAKSLWEKEYPDEPFEVDPSQSPDLSKFDKTKSKLQQYDLEEASYRQSKFYYQISLPHYKDTQFLEEAVERYEHHLHLTKENPGVFIVPCYDFDLIWHAHRLHPVNYNQSTTQFLGWLLHPHDAVKSCSPGSKLQDCEAETRKVWKAAGLLFTKSGAMRRGDPPDPLPPRPLWLYASLARCEYTVDVLQVETFNMGKRTFYIQLVGPEEQDILSHSFKGKFLFCLFSGRTDRATEIEPSSDAFFSPKTVLGKFSGHFSLHITSGENTAKHFTRRKKNRLITFFKHFFGFESEKRTLDSYAYEIGTKTTFSNAHLFCCTFYRTLTRPQELHKK